MKNKAFILISCENGGKTGTIKQWCESKGHTVKQGFNSFRTTINGKEELIFVTSCSQQERCGHLNVDKVTDLIIKQIKRYKEISKKEGCERFVWITAHTVGARKNQIGKETVRATIKELEKEDFDIVKIHLNRENYDDNERIKVKLEEINNFIKEIRDIEIISKENNEEEQAKELDRIITDKLKS